MPTPLAMAFIRVRPDADDFQREAEREFQRAGDQAGRRFSDSFSDQLGRSSGSEDAGDEAGRRFGGAFSDSLKVAAGVAIASFGAQAAGQLSEGFQQALDLTGAQGMFQAQLGVSADEAERIGGVAGKLFADAYGENMQEVQGAVTSVIQNMQGMKTASSDALETMTARAITVGQILGEDVSAVTRGVSQIMKTGLAPNAKAAFDIITRGAQLGLNSSEDLLDTFTEYSTQFRKLGLDGQTALGLIQQGLQGGARDADIVADALKEFSIRAIDGSDTTIAGFKALGLNATAMGKQIASGGVGASQGLDTVLDKLRSIESPTKRAEIAFQLFGTQSEDLGAALFKLDPSTATKGLGNLAGATDKASTALGDTPQAKFEAFKRGLQTSVVGYIASDVIPALEKISGALSGAGVSGSGLASVAVPLVGIGLAAKVTSSAVGAVRTGVDGVARAGRGIGNAAQGTARLAQGFRSADVAQSAFSGRMGTLGGKLRTAFNAGVSSARSFGSTVASAGAAAGRGLATAATAAGRAAASAATAAGSFLAMGARMLWAGTQAVFFAAKTAIAAAATKIWAGIQLAFNVIMAANPITLIIIGLVALGAAVVLAYNKFAWFRNAVNAVFNVLKTGVLFVVNFVRNHWRLILPILLGPLGLAISLVTKHWNSIKNVTMGTIRTAIDFVRKHWRLIISILLGPLGLAISLVTKHWKTIQTRVSSAVTTIINFVRNNWRKIIGFVSAPLITIVATVVRHWNRIKDLTQSLHNSIVGKIKSMMSGARNAFSNGVSAIGTAWGRLRDATKRPVNFVIGTVYNKGIVGLWNKVMGWLHLPGSLRLGTLPQLASGGPMPVRPGVFNKPTAIVGEGNQNHPEYVIPTDPKYRGRAMALWQAAGAKMQFLQLGGIIGGVKKLAGKVKNIGKQALDLITNPGKVWDTLVKAIPSADGLRTSPFGIGISEMPKLILKHAREYALKFFKAFGDGYGGSGSSVVNAALKYIGVGDDRGMDNNNIFTRGYGWPAGTPWCALFASRAIQDAKATKRYPGTPTAAVATFNAAMRHVGTGEGRPGDLATYGSNDHVNIIIKKVAGGYDTVGGNQGPRVNRYVRGGQATVLRPLAMGGAISAHMREVFRQKNFDRNDNRNPVLGAMRSMKNPRPLFDDGGFGQGWPFHKKKPEPVLTPVQWRDIHELAKRGAQGNVTVNLHGVPNVPGEKQVTNAIDNLYTLHGRW